MKKNKTTEQGDKNIVAVEEALGRSEQFIERNQKILIGVVAAIVIIIGGYIGFSRFIIEPREDQALSEMFMAERFFEQDSLRLALEGDGANLGFLDIISDFKWTKSANLARYYAGVSYLNLGEYSEAISHLRKFRKRDEIIGAMAYGALGDAYLQLDDKENAVRNYAKAARHSKNELTAPVFLMKLGMLHEINGDHNEALKAYQTIQQEYQNTNEGRNIERYIARVKMAINK